MKYLIFLVMICQILFTFETGIYRSMGEHESGRTCNEVIKDGKICKEEISSLILLPEGKTNKILLYNDKNAVVVVVFDKLTRKFLTYSIEKINDNIYKYNKRIEKAALIFGENFDGNLSYGNEMTEYEVILELELKNEIKIYDIINQSYTSDKYKLYRKLGEEESVTMKNYLKLIEELY